MKKKIIVSLLALFVFFTIGAAIAVLYMTDTTAKLKGIIELHEVEELRRSLIINIQTVQKNLYTANTQFAKDLDAVVSNVIELDKSADKCSSCHHRKELADRIISLQSFINDFETNLSRFITVRANSQRLLKYQRETVEIGDKLIEMAEQMSHNATTSLSDRTARAMIEINHVKIILLVTVIITFILGIMVALRLMSSVTQPVRALLNATRMIASGEYGSTIAYKDKTEFGELATHFNSMSTAIKEGYDNIQREIAERRQTEAALRQSEEKFRKFFEMSPIGIIIYPIELECLNKPLAFATFNSAFHNFFGYTREELNSKSIAELSYSEDLDKNYELSQELREGKRINYRMEKRYIKKSGEIVWGYINSTILRNVHHEPSQIITILVDINERKKMEEEQLKIEKLESVGILAGGIAHDFNNIMTSIAGNISLAKMSSDLGRNTYEILADTEEACRSAKDLTSQLLTFSKGNAPIKKVLSIAEQLRDSARIVLRGTKVNCEFSLPDNLWAVEVDEGQINQVIFNLLINASQAMPEGGTIRVSAENVDVDEQNALPLINRGYVKITFEDHGVGIPKEQLHKIFDPYFTTKQKGTGLGLSSTYSIIKNHDGYIEVKSAVNSGTIFHVYLPALKGEFPPENRKKPSIRTGEGKILLMDDDQNILSTVGKTLTKIGYKVELAKDGTEAIDHYKDALSDEPFDAVIMDLTIREWMGGKEAIGELLKIDPGAKVIVSSGYSTDKIMANFKEYGFCGVIIKPYQIEALSEVLYQVITQKAQ